ncbi:hypothetical protein, partial [Ruegeria lacuscaerulensis]|uniref:hypothetical protein n=1 Tax=Ruegeria lacuscaerulensis TaxID=55218 RepID=UPI00147F7FA3
LSKLETHYNDLHEQSRIERQQFKAGLEGLTQKYETALNALEQELKNERIATQSALENSSKIIAGYKNQELKINYLTKQVETLAKGLPRLTAHCETLSHSLTSLKDQSAQIAAELDCSRRR